MRKIAKIAAVACATALAATCAATAMAQPAQAAVAKPAQVKSVAAKAASSTSIKVTWKAVKGAKGYKVAYSTKSTMKGAKTVTVKGAKAKAKIVKGLKGCTRYYVKVRAYKTSKVLGKWSARKSAKTSHAYKSIAAVAPTCIDDGRTAYRQCTVCKAASGKATVPALGHALASHPAVDPTCTEPGNEAYEACKNCDFTTYQEIPALGHTGKGAYCSECGGATDGITYSWAELKAIANEIAACDTQDDALATAKSHGLLAADGKLTGNEAKSFEMTVTDSSGVTSTKTVQAQILGFNHDAKVDADGKDDGKAGITFGFKQIVGYHQMNPTDTNAGGWNASSMKTYLDGDFFSTLPSDLSSQIERVSKMSNNVGETDSVDSVTPVASQLWLLGMSECFGKLSAQTSNVPDRPAIYDAEGTQYQLYANNGVTSSNHAFMVKSFPGSTTADNWWLRSSDVRDRGNFRNLGGQSGDWFSGDANDANGVSPCFCL